MQKSQILSYLNRLRKAEAEIRIHGNGFIQIDESPGTRVHLWSRVIPRQTQYTGIHDHRFGFFSTVIYGDGLKNIMYVTGDTSNKDKETKAKESKEYRVYVAKQRQGEDTVLESTDIVLNINGFWSFYSIIRPRESYVMTAKTFHESVLDERQFCAITHMVKTDSDKDYQPRVLCPIDAVPDNDFNRDFFHKDYCWSLVNEIVNSHD